MKRNMLTNNLSKLYPTAPTPVAPTPNVAAPGNPVARSISGDSPFGFHADLSGLSPQQMEGLVSGLSDLTYSVPQGGYVFGPDPSHPSGYARDLAGGDPNANRAAASLYALVGSQPTSPNLTGALSKLYARTGETPRQAPSLNERLQTGGLPGPYGGPFTTPTYDPFKQFRRG